MLAAGFLERFHKIVADYNNFFKRFQRKEYHFVIPTPGCRADKVVIKGPYLYDNQEERLIILAYGMSENPVEEFSIFSELCNSYSIQAWQELIRGYEYWDLSKAEVQNIDLMNIKDISSDSLRVTFNRIASN